MARPLRIEFPDALVEHESHLLELARYVVLNPVRAGLVNGAENYRWSSLRATLGVDPVPGWLDVRGVLAHFASGRRYLEFVREGISAGSPWSDLKGSVLGSEHFARRIGERLDEKAADHEIPRRERLINRTRLEDLFPPRVREDRATRNDRIREANRTRGYSLVEISRHLGLHYSTVSRIVAARPGPARPGVR